MLRASTLLIVLAVATLIGLVCSALIMVAFHYRLQVLHNGIIKKLEANVQSGIELLLSQENGLSYNQPTTFDLFARETDSVTVTKGRWGVFEVGSVRAFAGRHASAKTILYGNALPADEAALYLVDNSLPLYLNGNTRITGKCLLPEVGWRKDQQTGNPFGEATITGAVGRSGKELPALRSATGAYLLQTFFSEGGPADTAARALDQLPDSLYQPFGSGMQYFRAAKPIHLRREKLRGHILIRSDTLITIGPGCSLEDIIAVAPRVVIEDGFRGALQVFATDSIGVGRHCVLAYPSVLGVFKTDFGTMQPAITLDSLCKVRGLVFTHREVDDLQQTLVRVHPAASVAGQVFVDGFLELRGSVAGTVHCRKFTLRTAASVYDNHLTDARIDRKQLSAHFVSGNLLPASSPPTKDIAKWVE